MRDSVRSSARSIDNPKTLDRAMALFLLESLPMLLDRWIDHACWKMQVAGMHSTTPELAAHTSDPDRHSSSSGLDPLPRRPVLPRSRGRCDPCRPMIGLVKQYINKEATNRNRNRGHIKHERKAVIVFYSFSFVGYRVRGLG